MGIRSARLSVVGGDPSGNNSKTIFDIVYMQVG